MSGIKFTNEDFTLYGADCQVFISTHDGEWDKENMVKQILENQKIVERLKKEIEYKEGWVRVNAYRITDHQTKLVKNEIKELKSILKESQS